ncbi:MAG TPA: hypothetical protein PLJ98_05425 [Acholeplasmataceae bacterium]|nr:hypothetical protein [Acholeplasmataceae bacterium]HPJ24475.1 hypothetical protein [Bacillota bacterium]
MVEQIIQYLPQALTTLGAVAVPMIPAFIMKAVSDKKAITTFEGIKKTSSTELQEIKTIADNLKAKEQLITQEVASVKNLTQTFDGKIANIEGLVDKKMQEVSDSVLAFQKDDVYQKMLAGLSQLDDLHKTIDSQANTIQRQAQELKEIKKKLG